MSDMTWCCQVLGIIVDVQRDDDLQLLAPLSLMYPSSAGSSCLFPSCTLAVICGASEAAASATRLASTNVDFMVLRFFV